MSYCISPACPAPDKNSPDTNFCMSCGAKILLKDRYRALSLLGQGGFGKTFKAVDEDQPRKPLSVIKQFAFSNNHPETRQIALKLFYEEAQHLEALGKHDQIPELLAYFDVEGQPYLVQQFIDGQDLEQELATAGTFNQTKIRELLESLLPVLDFLHHQSPPVIHRDIKPANIIRRRDDGGLVLVDFGAAKQATQSILAKTGTAIGSAEFAAPEQARRKPVFASDIYSLGVTCIYLLTQISPFDLFDMNQDAWVWRDYLVDNPVDEKLGKVLDKMIANILPQRYQSVMDVLTDLTDLTRKNTISTLPPSSASNLEYLDLSVNNNPNLEFFEFETAQIITIKKIVKKKISLKEGVVFKRWVEHEIDETVDVPEVKMRKGKSQQFVQDLGNGVKLEMIYIPAGSFMMGSNENPSEQPIHQVTLESFYMGKYTITQQQYETLMGRSPLLPPDNRDYHPVVDISFDNVVKFCKKLSEHTGKQYILPSESQWEYACRAGTETLFNVGDTITPNLANYDSNTGTCAIKSKQITIDTFQDTFYCKEKVIEMVCDFPSNAFGLYGMHGNVWEWCLDTWHENYKNAPTDGKAWISNNQDGRILRGGSFRSSQNSLCRSAMRNKENFSIATSYNSPSYGFRVVCLTK
jgi:formylglycine-generating enzyme required for sulfatase activity